MAATTSFTTLSVPAHDDSMDMSSPARRPFDDEDIDIDFDEYPAPIDDADIMLEDDITRPATATDEVMDEDVHLTTDAQQIQEELMQDDGLQIQDTSLQEDDELIDYSDDEELQEPTVADDAEIPNVTEAPTEMLEAVDEEFGEKTEPHDAETQDQRDLTADFATDAAQAQHPAANVASEAPPDAQAEAEAEFESDPNAAFTGAQQEIVFDETHEPEAGVEEGPEQPITINTTLDAPADGPDTPTDTGLHPMTLRFRDLHIPLFKSRKQLDGLLKDDNLANVSLADLISSCRQRLPFKIDEAITDDQDLVLSFDQLALMLVEDSRAAASTSLNEVLQVYLQLHHNDGVEECAPLSLTLTTQLRFSSSLGMFRQAVASGQGMSGFDFLHGLGDGDADHDQYELNGGEDWTGLTAKDQENGGEHTYDETTFAEQDAAADPTTGQDEQAAGNDEQYQDPDNEYYYDENAQGEYDEDFQGEAADALDGLAGREATTPHYAIKGEHETEDQDELVFPEDGAEAQVQDNTLPQAAENGDSATTTNTADNTDTAQNEDPTVGTIYDQAEDQDQQDPAAEDWLKEFPDQDQDPLNAQEYQQGHEEAGHQDGEQDDYTNIGHSTQHDAEETGDGTNHQADYEDHQDHQASEHAYTADEGFEDRNLYEHLDFQGDAAEPQAEEEEFDDTVLIHRPDEEAQESEDQVDDQNQNGQAEQPQEEDYEDIGFDEDDAIQPPGDVVTSNGHSGGSPLGKRSFDEIDGLDDDNVELPEVKKVRSS